MAVGRRRTPQQPRSERCSPRRALRPTLVLAALALLLAAAVGCAEDEPAAPAAPVPPSSTPTAVPPPNVQPIADYHGDPGGSFCEIDLLRGTPYRHFLHWTPGDEYLVFDVDETIWALHLDDTRLQEIADTQHAMDRAPASGLHADVSPDGSRIVYSTCEYRVDGVGTLYEIAMVNVDGTERRRLTETENYDGYPAWSPDGTEIAFVGIRTQRNRYPTGFDLVIAPAGEFQSGERVVAGRGYRIGPYPPGVVSQRTTRSVHRPRASR